MQEFDKFCFTLSSQVLDSWKTRVILTLGYNFIVKCPEEFHEYSTPRMFKNFSYSFGKRQSFNSK